MPYPLSQWSTTCPVGQLMYDKLGDAQTYLHHIMCKLTDNRRQKTASNGVDRIVLWDGSSETQYPGFSDY